MPRLSEQNHAAISKVINQARSENRKALTELESKGVLKKIGIPVTRHVLVKTLEDALMAAADLGYPLAMKIVSPAILHKTDASCVALDINSEGAVAEQFQRIISQGKKFAAPEEIQGVAIQEMVPSGREVIVGVKRDQIFGPTVLLGMGGVMVELMKDFSLRLVPLEREDILEMLSEIKGAKLLTGYRGSPPADMEKIVEIVLKVSALAQEFPEIEEMDLNPVVVYEAGQGAKVVDARMIISSGKEA